MELTENKNDDHDDSEQTSAPEPLPKMTSSHNQEHSATTLDGDKKTETSNKFRVSTGTYSVSVCSASATDPAITPASPQELDSGIPPTTTSPPSTPAPFQSSESDHNSSQNTDMKKKKKTVTMPNKYSLKKESENNIEGKQGKQPVVLSWVKRKLSLEKEADVENTSKLLRTESNQS